MNTLEPGVLRVGCWDKYFRHNQHSMTRLREPQPGFIWVDNTDDPAKCDIVLATQSSGMYLEGSKHPRRVLYLQETSEYHGNRDVNRYQDFDLVLTNDKWLLEHPALRGKVAYQTLFGTWLFPSEGALKKYKLCSLLAGPNNTLSGHRIRHEVARAARPGGTLHGLVDVHGRIDGGDFVPTERAYDGYHYNLAIENSNYAWWHTEKLFNCFATRTIPIYWGCQDHTKLREWGFDPSPIIPWDGKVETLAAILAKDLTWDHHKHTHALDLNYQRAHQLYCHELTLEIVLRKAFSFPETTTLMTSSVTP